MRNGKVLCEMRLSCTAHVYAKKSCRWRVDYAKEKRLTHVIQWNQNDRTNEGNEA